MITSLTYVLCVCLAFLAMRVWIRPGIGLTLVIAMYAIEQVLQPNIPFFLQYSWVLNVTITAIASCAVLSNFYSGGLRNFRITWTLVLYLLLIGLSYSSYYWTADKAETWQKLREALPYLLAFTIVAPWTVLNSRQLNNSFYWTLVLGFLVLLMIVLSPTGQRGVVAQTIQGKSLESNPLAASTYGGMVAIAAMFSIFMTRSNTLTTTLKVFMLAMAAYAIIRSGSRGQAVALVGTLCVWLPITARISVDQRTIVALIFGFTALVVGFVAMQQFGDNQGWFDRSNFDRWEWNQIESAQEGRLAMCAELLKEFADGGPFVWLFGLGNSSSFHYIGFYPHVVPIEVLCEEGLFGFCLFSTFLGMIFWKGTRLMLQTNIDADTRIVLGILLAMLTYNFVLALKQGSLIGSPLMFGMGLVAGQVIARLESLQRQLVNQRAWEKLTQSAPPFPSNSPESL